MMNGQHQLKILSPITKGGHPNMTSSMPPRDSLQALRVVCWRLRAERISWAQKDGPPPSRKSMNASAASHGRSLDPDTWNDLRLDLEVD